MWLVVCTLAVTSVAFSQSVTAQSTFEQAISEGDIRLNVTTSADEVVIKEQLNIELELLSLYPFAEDMVLPYVDIQDAVVVTDSKPITSSTRTIEGQKWYSQKTQLHVFPTTAKTFSLPELAVDTSIDSTGGEKSAGRVSAASAVEFTVTEIGGSGDNSRLVVGSSASLSVTTDRELDKELYVGDAVTFTYKLEVSGSNTIVLPEINIEPIKGTENYLKPPVKENVLNPLSKTNTAVLKQSVTVIVQEKGAYTLPEIQIPWWDTKNKQLETLSVSEQTMTAGNKGVIASLTNVDVQMLATKPIEWLTVNKTTLIIVIVLLSILVWASKKLTLFSDVALKHKKRAWLASQRKLFLSHIERKQYINAIQVAYLIVGSKSQSATDVSRHLNADSEPIWKKLQSAAFDEGKASTLSTTEASTLIEHLLSPKQIASEPFTFDLNLNGQK
jgi:hypothetical protein